MKAKSAPQRLTEFRVVIKIPQITAKEYHKITDSLTNALQHVASSVHHHLVGPIDEPATSDPPIEGDSTSSFRFSIELVQDKVGTVWKVDEVIRRPPVVADWKVEVNDANIPEEDDDEPEYGFDTDEEDEEDVRRHLRAKMPGAVGTGGNRLRLAMLGI